MFLSVDLLSEYWIQHSANGPLYVTSSYSTWIFCRGFSGFATHCPCGVWCRGLTTCLLHVGLPFGNRIFKPQLGCRFDIMDNISYSLLVFWLKQLYMSWYVRSFFGFTFLNILYFFKYSCTNIFDRRSLYTFYSKNGTAKIPMNFLELGNSINGEHQVSWISVQSHKLTSESLLQR